MRTPTDSLGLFDSSPSRSTSLHRCILLTGIPGVGKTRLGYEVGKLLKLRMFDPENILREQLKQRLGDIKREYGSDRMATWLMDLLLPEIQDGTNTIIACPPNLASRHDFQDLVAPYADTILLQAMPLQTYAHIVAREATLDTRSGTIARNRRESELLVSTAKLSFLHKYWTSFAPKLSSPYRVRLTGNLSRDCAAIGAKILAIQLNAR